MAITQRQLLAELERQNEQKWMTETVDSFEKIAELQKMVADGDDSGTWPLVEIGIATGRYGAHLEKEGKIWNEELGLTKHTLDEVLADALATLK
jgi:D-serine deaminase-like pyridoxal phosphate-dependent protein